MPGPPAARSRTGLASVPFASVGNDAKMPLPRYEPSSVEAAGRPPGPLARGIIVASVIGSWGCFLAALTTSADGNQSAKAAMAIFQAWDFKAVMISTVGSLFSSNAVNRKTKQSHPGIYGFAWANFLTFALTGGLLALVGIGAGGR